MNDLNDELKKLNWVDWMIILMTGILLTFTFVSITIYFGIKF